MPKEPDAAKPGSPTHDGESSTPRGSNRAGVLAVLLGAAILGGGYLLSLEQQITIFVVSLDTTRPDHLTAYGYDRETTPTLERLAREGTRSVNASPNPSSHSCSGREMANSASSCFSRRWRLFSA